MIRLSIDPSWTHRLFHALAVILIGYHLYAAEFGHLLPLEHRAIFVGLILAIGFVTLSIRRGAREPGERLPLYDVVLALTGLTTCGYVVWRTPYFNQFPGQVNERELILGTILIILVFEVARRAIGYTFMALCAVTVVYALISDHAPGIWRSIPYSPEAVITRLYGTNVGLWGDIVGIAAKEIALLLIMACVIMAVGGMAVMRDLALALTGRRVGGPAKAANVCSMLMGTISGSSSASAATVGGFTIPMMKSAGYPGAFAAGLEATSAVFGQILPPVMGASAFVIAEYVGVPYWDVVKVATLPALLVYISIFGGIHFFARRHNLRPMTRAEVAAYDPQFQWYRLVPVLLPLFVLIFQLSAGRSAERAALLAIYSAVGTYLLLTPVRAKNWDFVAPLRDIYEGLVDAAKSIAMIGALIVAAQVFVSLVNATSVGVKMSNSLVDLAEGNLLAGLFLAALISMILGLALPTTASYVIAAATCSTALINMGADPLAAHMFLFFFAALSALTPPTCVPVFIAAEIAKVSWTKAVVHAMALSILKYIVPFVIVYQGAIRFEGSPAEVLLICGAVGLAGVCIEAVLWNYWRVKLKVSERLGLLVACIALFSLQTPLMASGSIVAGVVISSHYLRIRKDPSLLVHEGDQSGLTPDMLIASSKNTSDV